MFQLHVLFGLALLSWSGQGVIRCLFWPIALDLSALLTSSQVPATAICTSSFCRVIKAARSIRPKVPSGLQKQHLPSFTCLQSSRTCCQSVPLGFPHSHFLLIHMCWISQDENRMHNPTHGLRFLASVVEYLSIINCLYILEDKGNKDRTLDIACGALQTQCCLPSPSLALSFFILTQPSTMDVEAHLQVQTEAQQVHIKDTHHCTGAEMGLASGLPDTGASWWLRW